MKSVGILLFLTSGNGFSVPHDHAGIQKWDFQVVKCRKTMVREKVALNCVNWEMISWIIDSGNDANEKMISWIAESGNYVIGKMIFWIEKTWTPAKNFWIVWNGWKIIKMTCWIWENDLWYDWNGLNEWSGNGRRVGGRCRLVFIKWNENYWRYFKR